MTTVPTRAHLRQVLLARARMALSALPDQLAAAVMALPEPRSREAVERLLTTLIATRLDELQASPPSVAELGTVH